MANIDDCKLDKSKLNLDLLIRAGLRFFYFGMICCLSDYIGNVNVGHFCSNMFG